MTNLRDLDQYAHNREIEMIKKMKEEVYLRPLLKSCTLDLFVFVA